MIKNNTIPSLYLHLTVSFVDSFNLNKFICYNRILFYSSLVYVCLWSIDYWISAPQWSNNQRSVYSFVHSSWSSLFLLLFLNFRCVYDFVVILAFTYLHIHIGLQLECTSFIFFSIWMAWIFNLPPSTNNKYHEPAHQLTKTSAKWLFMFSICLTFNKFNSKYKNALRSLLHKLFFRYNESFLLHDKMNYFFFFSFNLIHRLFTALVVIRTIQQTYTHSTNSTLIHST